MKSRGTKSGMLVAVLVLWCGYMSADEKNKASELFNRMEKKLAEADTLQLTIHGKMTIPGLTADRKDEGIIKATLLIASGNKARMDYSVQAQGQTEERIIVSNGTRLKSIFMGRGTQENDTPKSLSADMVYTLSRIGLTADLMHMRPEPLSNDKPKKDNILLSDFRLDKQEKIGDREVHVIHYQYAFAGEDKKFVTTLYIEVKTLLPVARTVPAHGNLREEYQYRLNEKIGEERFVMPK